MSGCFVANLSARTKRCPTAAISTLFSLCIYELLTLMTATALRSRGVPVIAGADLSLYLNLSNVGPSREHLNPYYGTVTQPASRPRSLGTRCGHFSILTIA